MIYKEIGKRLRYYRKRSHFSVEDVKEYLGIGSRQAIYKWESGGGYPQTDTMLALMELYGIEVKELIGETMEIYSDTIYVASMNAFIIKERRLEIVEKKHEQLKKKIEKYYIKNVITQLKAAVV